MRTILGSMTKKQKDYFTKENFFKIENERKAGYDRSTGIVSISIIVEKDYCIILSEEDWNELVKTICSLYSNPLFLTLNVMTKISPDIVFFDDIKKNMNFKNIQQYITGIFITYKILINGAKKCDHCIAEKLKSKFMGSCHKIRRFMIMSRNSKNTFSSTEDYFLGTVLNSIEKAMSH